MQIKITRTWRGRGRTFAPGAYAIPRDISRVHASCCVHDGAGELLKDETFRQQPEPPARPAARGRRKTAAPENKLSEVPEDKTDLGRRAGDRGGDGTESDA